MSRRSAAFATIAAAALAAGCGGSGTAASSAIDPGQVQVATSEHARQDGANVSQRLEAAGYRVVGSAPAGGGVGAFAVTFDGGGVVVVLVLDSNSQADLVANSFRPSSASPDALVERRATHVYAANTIGTSGTAVSQADLDKLVAAGEGAG